MTGIPLTACTVRADLTESLRVAEGNAVPLVSIERHIMPPLDLRPRGTQTPIKRGLEGWTEQERGDARAYAHH